VLAERTDFQGTQILDMLVVQLCCQYRLNLPGLVRSSWAVSPYHLNIR